MFLETVIEKKILSYIHGFMDTITFGKLDLRMFQGPQELTHLQLPLYPGHKGGSGVYPRNVGDEVGIHLGWEAGLLLSGLNEINKIYIVTFSS